MTERSEGIIRLSPPGRGACSRPDTRTATRGTDISEQAS